jgi:hypothetical protein
MSQLPPQITPEARAKEVLSRFSLFDLREILPEQIERGEELLKAKPCSIQSQGQVGFFDWFKVQSGSEIYEVRQFLTFYFCGCNSFFFNHYCRHVSAVTPPSCKCGNPVKERLTECERCEQKHAIYYKPETTSVKIGGFRI